MKRFVVLLVLWWPQLVPGQEGDTLLLPEVDVSSALWQKVAVGQNRVVRNARELGNQSDASLAREIGQSSPVNFTGTGPGLLANPVIRGTHANGTQIFWNGMPVNSPTLGTSDLNLFRSAAFNQISVIPGGSGTELGGGTMGGAILLGRELTYDSTQTIGGLLGGGAYGEQSLRAAFDIGRERFTLQGGFTRFASRNDFPFPGLYGREYHLDNAAISAHGAFASTGWRWAKKGEWQSHLLWQNHQRQIPDSRSVYNPARPSEAIELDDQVRWQNILTFNDFRLEQGFNFEWQQYRDKRFFIEDTNNFFQSSTELEHQYKWSNQINLLSGVYLNYHRARGSNIDQGQAEYGWRSALFWRIGSRWLLRPALAQSFLDEQSMALLPSLASEYYLGSHWAIKAKTGRVFSIPTLNQRYWPGVGIVDILPETGWNNEIGLSYQRNRHQVHLAFYYNRLNNKVVWLPAPLGARPRNFRSVRTPGLELTGDHRWRENPHLEWVFRYAVNYSQPRVGENYEGLGPTQGNLLIYIPPLTASTRLGIKWKHWHMYFDLEYNSGAHTTADNDPLARLEPFALVHWQVEWRARPGRWSLVPGIEIDNLLDQYYERYAFRPMPGRVWRIYLRLNHTL